MSPPHLGRFHFVFFVPARPGCRVADGFSPQVDPEIVGGLVVEIGDKTIDLSVSGRISKMNKLLTDAL